MLVNTIIYANVKKTRGSIMAKEKKADKALGTEGKSREMLAEIAENVDNLKNLHNLQGQLLRGLEIKLGRYGE
jgi:hypothetical protein